MARDGELDYTSIPSPSSDTGPSGFDRLEEMDDGVVKTNSNNSSQDTNGIDVNEFNSSVVQDYVHPAKVVEHLESIDNVCGIRKTSSSTPESPFGSHLLQPPINYDHIKSKSQPTSRRSSVTSLRNFNKFTKSYIIPAAKWAYSPLSNNHKHKKKVQNPHYTIEYSVFKPPRNLRPVKNEREYMLHEQLLLQEEILVTKFHENFVSPESFSRKLDHIIHLIEEENINPQRISQGSSGSYFVLERSLTDSEVTKLKKAGIFKPKDEEPYGPLSPKWTKWLHRTFFPCFFGRSCLIPNLGYVSEAAASTLDRQLLSYIVPHTEIVHLKSKAFYYSYWNRRKILSRLPYKIGSFQCFLNKYVDAQSWFKRYPFPLDISNLPESSEIVVDINETDLDGKFTWTSTSVREFREELEKLVILDYIMRNTDRGLDNWMIKLEWKETFADKTSKKFKPIIKIGAIDSGLAFPWKHPDEWRSFPFGWLFLPLSLIGQPFSLKTRNHYLPLLTSTYWWECTVKRLKAVFVQDNDFSERMWHKQLSVLKGQAFNVVEVLKLGHAGPLELTRRENLLVWDDEMNVPVQIDNHIILNAMETSIYELNNKPTKFVMSSKIDTINELEPTERSPLLPENSSINSVASEPQMNMSGYEYNLNFNDDNSNENDDRETNTKKVVIERLEKVKSKPPVFTWC